MNFLLGKKAKKRNRDPTENPEGDKPNGNQPRDVYHFPSTASGRSFPIAIEEGFPRLKYHSRGHDVKTAIHWGQRKLFLSELQLLIYYCKPGVSYHIVYAGSAPGTHLKVLDKLFKECNHTWELVDPGRFDRATLEPLQPKFKLRNEFFTNAVAYEIASERLTKHHPALKQVYLHLAGMLDDVVAEEKVEEATTTEEAKRVEAEHAAELQESLQDKLGNADVARMTEDIPSMWEPLAPGLAKIKSGKKTNGGGLHLLFQVAMEKKPLLFVSDIRSGSPKYPNFEEHVAENMRAQQMWTEILCGDYSLLKFRLPYTVTRGVGVHGHGTTSRWVGDGKASVEYVNGTVLLPIWTRPTSTEGRLVVKAGALRRAWDIQEYEDQFCYFNAVVRERLHFNHSLSPSLDLDNHYDAAAEVELWRRYLEHKKESIAATTTAGGSNLNSAATTDVSEEKTQITELVNRLSVEIKGTFSGAIAARERLMMGLARGTHTSGQAGLDDNEEPDHQPVIPGDNSGLSSADREKYISRILKAAAKERMRLLWNKNVDENTLEEKGSGDAAPAAGSSGAETEFDLWGCKLVKDF